MLETPEELARLQALLDDSHGRATEHLRDIIHEGRTLSAEQGAMERVPAKDRTPGKSPFDISNVAITDIAVQ